MADAILSGKVTEKVSGSRGENHTITFRGKSYTYNPNNFNPKNPNDVAAANLSGLFAATSKFTSKNEAKIKALYSNNLKQDQFYNYAVQDNPRIKQAKTEAIKIFGVDDKNIDVNTSNKRDSYIVSLKDLTKEERDRIQGKDLSQDGNHITIKKLSDTEYQVVYKNPSENPLNQTSPIVIKPVLGEEVRRFFNSGQTHTEYMDLGNGAKVRFEKVITTDERTPDGYKAWYKQGNGLPDVPLKSNTGTTFNDFASAWNFTNAALNTGKNYAEQQKFFSDYLQKTNNQ